jgi:hypothetical protein
MRQPIDNRVPTRGGVGRTHGSSRRTIKDGGHGNFSKEPPYHAFPAAGDPKDRRRQTVPLLRLRPTSIMRSIRPRLQGRLKALEGLATASERRALALLPICPPLVPTPSSLRRSVRTLLRQKYFANAAPAPSSGEYLRVFSRGKDISDMPSGRSLCRCTDIMFFQNPPYRASRVLMIPRIAGVGTSFCPLPCQAWHGYMVTSAHRLEVEVSADGHASAPLSGAAAAAPPAGAVIFNSLD